ncbi:MAG: glycosyltransferase family 39 protein [Anaerolinea sp.]|nr:glycosyltransferase family 39 protein [Anaerolinea sp.]
MLKKAWFLPVLLFLVALAARSVGLGQYVTPDELIWVYRSVQFREALLARAWAGTMVSGHPGVVTTWLGAVGISLQMWVDAPSREVYVWLTHMAWLTPDNTAALQHLAHFLTAARLGVIVVNSLGVTAVYLLATRLFNRRLGLLAALLLALDPFVVGLSGLLHVDGLMTTFTAVSLLALALWVSDTGKHRFSWAGLAGVTAVCAILTKSPAILLLPFTGMFLGLRWLWTVWRQRDQAGAALRRLLIEGSVWLLTFVVVGLLLFPALWSDPGHVFTFASNNANRHLEEALRPTFFLGQVSFKHGPLFYPLALALRLGPVVFLGLAVGVVLLRQRPFRTQFTALPAWIWLIWPLLFLAGMSVAAKKFDRYLLPAIPALTLLAAVAWSHVRLPRGNRWLLPLLVGAQGVYLLTAVPYPLAAYNPLLGGARVAAQIMTVGWGEAISAAGSWLSAASGDGAAGNGAAAVASIAPSLAPFFNGTTLLQSDEAMARADYVIVTAADRQIDAAAVTNQTQNLELLHTIHYAGLDQAWIYRQPSPLPPLLSIEPWSEPLLFGSQAQVWGLAVSATPKQADVLIRWGLAGPVDGRFNVKLLLRDDEGHVWAWREIDLVNDVAFYPEYWEPGEKPDARYVIPLPPAMPPVAYNLELALFAANGAQLPLLAADGRFQGTSYTQPGVAIPKSTTPPLLITLGIPAPLHIPWGEGLLLLGRSAVPQKVITGGQLDLDLYWQAVSTLPAGATITWQLGDDYRVTLPLSRYDTARWQPGDLLHEKYTLPIPPQMPGGRYTLWAGDVALGEVEVLATDRLFTLPADIPISLAYRFGEGLSLRGLRLDGAAVPGSRAQLTLYWQTETAPDEIITAFVHVLDAQGEIVAQSDHWPGGLPSNTWAAGQVIVDEITLDVPANLPPGAYALAVGVYLADNGLRLTVTDAEGTAVADDRLFLPVPLVLRQ